MRRHIQLGVRFLAELADDGHALEFAIGTGRVAIPLIEHGVPVAGIELSQPMADQLNRKRTDIPVVIGDMATTTVAGQFSLVYVVWNSISNLRTQPEQVACFRNGVQGVRRQAGSAPFGQSEVSSIGAAAAVGQAFA
ncbi:methyltransferase domain-containing protein [Mangrovihabitans endophyticus]|uniref:Methyltransferase domain-containing protein n=1 Tax=Mangrovihabitans endophyticus TaxID=1751298 RepID=A0A8J3BXS4_9ACTN|nr:hypothetical protein GCM10012284_11700 [Mangrovihabitans endophyticus]